MHHPSPAQIFQQYLPQASIPYCYDLWKRYPFELKLKNPRQTKLGDFCTMRGRKPIITLNKDLYPYMFLVTYIHEFSHHAVHMVYGNLPEAHGKEWKLAFKTFMGPIMDLNLFPVRRAIQPGSVGMCQVSTVPMVTLARSTFLPGISTQ